MSQRCSTPTRLSSSATPPSRTPRSPVSSIARVTSTSTQRSTPAATPSPSATQISSSATTQPRSLAFIKTPAAVPTERPKTSKKKKFDATVLMLEQTHPSRSTQPLSSNPEQSELALYKDLVLDNLRAKKTLTQLLRRHTKPSQLYSWKQVRHTSEDKARHHRPAPQDHHVGRRLSPYNTDAPFLRTRFSLKPKPLTMTSPGATSPLSSGGDPATTAAADDFSTLSARCECASLNTPLCCVSCQIDSFLPSPLMKKAARAQSPQELHSLTVPLVFADRSLAPTYSHQALRRTLLKRDLKKISLSAEESKHRNHTARLSLNANRLRRYLTLMVARETFRHALAPNPPLPTTTQQDACIDLEQDGMAEEEPHYRDLESMLNIAFPIPSKLQSDMALFDALLRIDPVSALAPPSGALAPTQSQLLLLLKKPVSEVINPKPRS